MDYTVAKYGRELNQPGYITSAMGLNVFKEESKQ
jgi:hypothetical protein